MNVTEEQRQQALYLAQAAVMLLSPSGRFLEDRGLVLQRLTVEVNGLEAVQVWTCTPHTCVLCVTDCGDVVIYHPQTAWEQVLLTWAQERERPGGAAPHCPAELPASLHFDVQVSPVLLEHAREDEQHAQLTARVLSALEQVGAAMLRSYERWLLRDTQSTPRTLQRERRSVAWTGNPELPGQVVTRNVLPQTLEDVARESTALFLKELGHG